MAFYFPKDEELFEDLENIGERSKDLNQLHRLIERVEGAKKAAEFEDDDGSMLKKLYGDESEAQEELTAFFADLCIRYFDSDSDAFWNDAEQGIGLFDTNAFGETIRNIEKADKGDTDYFEKLYLLQEKCAASAALSPNIGWFPDWGALMYQKTDLAKREMQFSSYFGEMDKCFTFMKGAGKLGKILKEARTKLDAIGKAEKALEAKADTAAIFPLFFVLVGALLVLGGGGLIPVVPDFLTPLLENSLIVRLIVGAIMGLTGVAVVIMSKVVMEEDSGCGLLTKIVCNGIVALVGGGLAVLCALKSIGGIEPFELLIFGMYDILFGGCFMLEDAAQRRKQKKALAEAKREVEVQKAAFRKLVEENIQYMHRYIRLHELWYKNTYKKDGELPKGILALKKSFDHLLTMYNRYS